MKMKKLIAAIILVAWSWAGSANAEKWECAESSWHEPSLTLESTGPDTGAARFDGLSVDTFYHVSGFRRGWAWREGDTFHVITLIAGRAQYSTMAGTSDEPELTISWSDCKLIEQ